MAKRGKKHINAKQSVDKKNLLSVPEALTQVKTLAYAKFNESVDVNINLGIDATKGDQVVRGSVVLPHSIGKAVRVAVFAKGDAATEAQKAGADIVGAEELIEKILGGWMEFEYTVATPDMMVAIGKLAKVLGPKGLLPNKKLGTVTTDVAPVIKELKQGKLFFKNDKNGLVHFTIGKLSLDARQLEENFSVFMKTLTSCKPASSKGKFIRKITVSSTMGVGVSVNPESIS